MLKRFTPLLTLVGLCWLVFFANYLIWHGALNHYGIVPRHLRSLPGILWAPFLHGSLKHLIANTVPLLILGAVICARSPAEFRTVTFGGILLGGALTWAFGRSAFHIGASGLIFCFFGYLASLAYFRRTLGTLVLSVVCLLAYGGMLRGVFPTDSGVSWESHAGGLVAGVVLAWFSAKASPSRESSNSLTT